MTDDRDDETEEVAERLRARRRRSPPNDAGICARVSCALPQFAPRPPHLWLLVLAFALSGLVLLAIAATQI